MSSTARDQGNGQFADFYNTAIYIANAKPTQIYHKSKLVPGVEKMPFPYLLKFLEKYSINNGGISGSLGVDAEPKVMMGNQAKVGPVICYESVYGDYVREYANKGANLISIITNDGWWGNTDGYKQHLNYASLRAIETRRSIARSANTGISAFIDERGDIYKQSEWWQPTVLTANVTLNERVTFYSMTGDYISIAGIFAGLFLGVLSIFKTKKVIKAKIDTSNKINE
ncbi:MAG: apolipoprotein N-acyltransferase [Bacteroidetes bacterium]|nr:apolipoprotein N-acyltransferase [Bacteroidota bacterium]